MENQLKPREVDVFSYLDFRDFLKDYYSTRRKKDRKFSIRFFARRAGLKSQNYLKVVMDGRRSLTSRNIPKFVKGLGLDRNQAEFFEALVNLNQARDEMEKQGFLDKINHLKKKQRAVTLDENQKEFFNNWYHVVIYEMASQENFNPDPSYISKRLRGTISPKQAQESLDLMMRLGLLIKAEGRWKTIAAQIASPEKFPRETITKLHRSYLQKSIDALEDASTEDKLFRTLTIALTKDQMPLFMARMRDFQREMNTSFSTGKGKDIYIMNMQFFKLTKTEQED